SCSPRVSTKAYSRAYARALIGRNRRRVARPCVAPRRRVLVSAARLSRADGRARVTTLLAMPFAAEDIEPTEYVPGTTALAYALLRDGTYVDHVRSFAAVGWLNAGQDPHGHIARELDDLEASQRSMRSRRPDA